MAKYVASRKDVCAGQLIKNLEFKVKVTDENGREFSQEELAALKMSCSAGLICRGMLFNVNDDGLANDLIYTTPVNYSISGIEPKVEVASDFSIEHYVELDELLEYLNYGIDLTQHDLNRIQRTLVTSDSWLNRHMELFGWKKLDCGGYSNGGVATLPMNIYDNLSHVSCVRNGKPHVEEPGYSYIKKRNAFFSR